MNRTSLCIRMLLILKANATKQNPINSKELAQALEVNPRNIREYKRELITAGYNPKGFSTDVVNYIASAENSEEIISYLEKETS